MRQNRQRTAAVAGLTGLVAASALATGYGVTASAQDRTTAAAPAAAPVFSNPRDINNRYLPLTRKKTCVIKGRTTDGEKERSVRTVLKQTKRFMFNGAPVDVAVIRDNAYEGGELVESTLDYFGQADDGTVYYFGEQVKNLRNGEVVNRKGTWLYGKDTDRLGIAMLPEPQLGEQWNFEDVPGVTTESNRVEETGLRTKVKKWGVRTDVIRVQEFIQPEGEIEYKLYASGIGLVKVYAPDAISRFAGCS